MYIALDTETGGLTDYTSTLTAYFLILDKDFNKIDDLSLKMKSPDGEYVVTAEALEINGIDLIKHDAEAILEKEAGTKIYEFLEKNNPDGKIKLIPIGQNVAFDIKRLHGQQIIAKGSWEKYVSYRVLDTATIALFLKILNKIPENVKGSLGSLKEHFNILDEELHTADGDARVCVEVLKKMLGL